VNKILNEDAEMCHISSAERLKHAARQPGPWRERMAAAVRDLGHVSLQLHHIQPPRYGDAQPQQLDDALSVLREHPRLRGLAIIRSSSWWHPVDPQLAEILHVHKGSLKELRLDLPMRFPTGLTDAVAGLGGLESLSVNNLDLGGERFLLADANSARRLADALGALQNLRSLALSGFSDVNVLTACLPRLRHLESLRISTCEADPEAWHAIARHLQGLQAADRAPLRHLALCTDRAKEVDFAPLAPVVSGMSGLHELVLSGYRFCPVGVAMLAADLQGMGELKLLELSRNHMNASAIGPLACALEKLPQLEELNLRDLGRRFGDVGLLAAKLKGCLLLKTLVLTGNSAWTPEVVEALAAALAGLPQLETFHLPELHRDGLPALLPALQVLQGCSLRKVVLDPTNARRVDELRAKLPGVEVS